MEGGGGAADVRRVQEAGEVVAGADDALRDGFADGLVSGGHGAPFRWLRTDCPEVARRIPGRAHFHFRRADLLTGGIHCHKM
ncbi:hypothetical protein GCM10010319_13490 [Streptomyces blastmyceticus]|uniref:Uncharacterized protein n=1 Tax=Streptomyces blastmyceticus TaxID=68180 RepID=A0ABN0WIK4_9ACTN